MQPREGSRACVNGRFASGRASCVKSVPNQVWIHFVRPQGKGVAQTISVSPVFSMKAEAIEAFWTIPPWAVSHLMIQPLRYNCWKWCLLLAKAML